MRGYALAALCALAFGLSSAFARSDAAESTTATIAGVVSDAGGSAIAGATVAAASPSGEYRATTDVRGAFRLLGMAPGTYTISVEARGYGVIVRRGIVAAPALVRRLAVHLIRSVATIGRVGSRIDAIDAGAVAERFVAGGDLARPAENASGLAGYSAGTVQGAAAGVPGIGLDTFGNLIVRGGKVEDTVFDFDSVPIPQGLIAEPGGNIVGAQLGLTGVSTAVATLAGFSNQGDNALGGVVDLVPLTGTYPARNTIELGVGAGVRDQRFSWESQWATPDLRWRYAAGATLSSEYFSYGDGHTFYPSEAATYGLSLQTRAAASFAGNVHFRAGARDDLSFVALSGEATYQQYGSPYPGETYGAFDGAITPFPGATNPNAAVTFASGLRGTYDVLKAQWLHTGSAATTRLQLYQTQFGSSAGGPFWDDLSFPDGVIALAATQGGRETGASFDVDAPANERHHLLYGAEYRINNSFLYQTVPTADETIASNPTLFSSLAYAGDTWSFARRFDLAATARYTRTRIVPSAGTPYAVAAIDPHAALAYRFGGSYSLRAAFDHTTVAPKPLEADRTDSANPAPFVPLAPETSNLLTYAFEGGGRTKFRLVYYDESEQNRIDVLPVNFRGAVAAGENPSGVGVPTNAGALIAHGFDLWVHSGPFVLKADSIRGYSSSASQFAYNGLNAAAVAAGHLFPLGYVPDVTVTLSYEIGLWRKRVRVTPSLSYQSGYPYGNGTMIYQFDPRTGRPVHVPNDNFVNPGYNYYFLANPALPFDAATNPYVGSLGTAEGPDPNSLRAPPQTLVSVHVEGDITPRLTALLDVTNLFATSSPTALQGNPYLIGPPGYTGNNPLYAAAYQAAAGFAQPYVLGNGVPTNDGVHQAVPWQYGTGAYVPQGFPLARTFTFSLRYRF